MRKGNAVLSQVWKETQDQKIYKKKHHEREQQIKKKKITIDCRKPKDLVSIYTKIQEDISTMKQEWDTIKWK